MLIRGEAARLPLLDGVANCVVTSPPYWRQRDYGDARQIGRERTPEDYASALGAVFDEVSRVLTDDGTAWVNLDDTYEDKSLVGVPWMVAFELKRRGWYLRCDIVWDKPNGMTESVTDRTTRMHEYLFLLTKSARYAYDWKAIAEPVTDAMLQQVEDGYDGTATKDYEGAGVQDPSDVKRRIIGNYRKRADRFGGNKHRGGTTQHSDGSIYTGRPPRNRRSVWRIPVQPFGGAHFATFPERLAARCILAGCPVGGLVLDPFVGAGTTVLAASRLGRRAVGVDLSYQAMARLRTAQRGLPYSGVL